MIAPKKFSKITSKNKTQSIPVISMFCGCGGLDLGFKGGFTYRNQKYKKLPFDIIQCYDNDAESTHTYNINFKVKPVLCDLSSAEARTMPKARVLIGGFPCQDFALCGSRKGIKTKRGKLFRAMTSYLHHHKPDIFVAENVAGLTSLQKGKLLKKIIAEFTAEGYVVQKFLVSAYDYGVPQKRIRLFLIGCRNDIKGQFFFPRPINNKTRSIQWAIDDLANIDPDLVPNQNQFFLAARAKTGHGQGDEVSYPDKPGYTVRANAKSRIQFHYKLDRRLTIRECARLQTFPDSFQFPYCATTNIRMIGNAVPPILAYQIAKNVERFLRDIDSNF